MTTPILEVNELCVSYGKVEALHRINLKVSAGQIVTVIGPNGAGKTTFSFVHVFVQLHPGDTVAIF